MINFFNFTLADAEKQVNSPMTTRKFVNATTYKPLEDQAQKQLDNMLTKTKYNIITRRFHNE